jgi:hypothetical protein
MVMAGARPRPGMVEIDVWERFAYPLAFFPDGPVGRGFGKWRQPIEDGQPCQREQVIGPVENFEAETTEHGSTISRDHEARPNR